MTDYPAHLARYHVMLNAANPVLAQNYTFEWAWSGNLGVDVLIRVLGPILGLETAGRVTAAAIPMITAAAIFRLEWVLRGRLGAGSLLALPTVWSPSLLLGFTNFSLSVGLALFALSWWIVRSREGLSLAVFVTVGLIVFLCHASGWGILSICVFGYEAAVRRKFWPAVLATWTMWPPLALLGFHHAGSGGLLDYGASPVSSKLDNWLRPLAAYHGGQDVLTTLVLLMSVVAAAATRRFDPRIGWSALLLAMLTFVIPRHFGGGDFADYRLTTPSLMLACLAIDLPLPLIGMIAGVIPFAIRVATITSCWAQTSAQLDRALQALDGIPRGARVYGAVHRPSDGWQLSTWSHIVSYATVRRDAVTNSDFAIPGVHMLSLRRRDAPHDPNYWLPEDRGIRPDLAAFAAKFPADYLWYIGSEPPAKLPRGSLVIFRTQTTAMIKLAAAGD